MAFFFAKHKKAKAAKQPAKSQLRQAPLKKQDATILHRLGCKACPLDKIGCKTPKMGLSGFGSTGAGLDIYFLAEAPGKHEDEVSHKPLTGPSGTLLRSCLPHDGAVNVNAIFDNIVNCRPPSNRTPTFTEIECCRPRREKAVSTNKPKLIVGLGAVPMQAMLGSTDLTGMRGRPFAINVGGHPCWFMPTYHPSFILRTAFDKKKPLKSKFGHCFKMDVRRAFDLVNNLPPAVVDTPEVATAGLQCFDGAGAGDYRAVLTLLGEARKAHIKAIDIETQGLRPYAQDAAILTCAISFMQAGPVMSRGTHFSFALQHPQAKWTPEQLFKIDQQLFYLLAEDQLKIAHNAPMEIEWFIWYFDNRRVVNHLTWECTQMQAHFLDERRGRQWKGDDERRAAYQGLGFLTKQYFGLDVKKLFKLNKKNMAGENLQDILKYNAVDTKFTLKLYHYQKKLLQEQDLFDAYREALPRQPTVALMQSIGIGVDQVENKRARDKVSAEIKELRAKIADLSVVKAFIKDTGEFNPDSGPQVVRIFKDYLKRKEVIDDDAKSGFSADKNVLSTIDHPLAGLLLDLRNRSKLQSTYLDPFELGKGSCIWPDGLMHTSFNTTFAETGRTSSDEPNQQNWPQRKDAWVRKQVVPPPGHVILAFDYGQLEGCTSAVCSKDKILIKALWEDYDLHMEWAGKTAKLIPEILEGDFSEEEYKRKFRSLIKNKLVFPAIFGAKDESIAGYLNAPVEKISKLMKEFWGTFHGLYSWQEALMKDYYETGFVSSPTGRRHRYPLTRNQAINFPIQSFACDIVCNAMNELSVMASETGQWHLHPVLNIHDDLTAVIPDDDQIIEDAIKTYYTTMLSPPYRCVNVPLSVECSIGKNWFDMKKIGKFWSHKDLK